jgi:hypothetical protein
MPQLSNLAGAILDAPQSTREYALGTRGYGGGDEWIYCECSTSLTQYMAVAIQPDYKMTPLTITTGKTAMEIGFIQYAMGTKNTFGWCQIAGRPIVKMALACQPDVPLYATATAGVLDDASTSVAIQGLVAVTQVTNSAGQATCVARHVSAMVEPGA